MTGSLECLWMKYNVRFIILSIISITSVLGAFIISHYITNTILTIPFILGIVGSVVSVPRIWRDTQ